MKKKFKPVDRTRERQIATEWRQLQKPPKAMQIEEWLDKWERIYEEALEVQLPEVNGERPQFDFLLAIKQIDSSFSATNINDIENRLLEDRPIPELDHFIQRFRNQYRMEEAAGLKYHLTTLATLHSLDEDSKPKPNSNNLNNSNNLKDELRVT